METLGQKLRRLRLERRIPQGELCEHVSLTSKALGDIERDAAVPNLRTLFRIGDALGLTPSWILRNVEVERFPAGKGPKGENMSRDCHGTNRDVA
jgi:transcriptional regulator with XRE-family HTH domain